MQKMLRYEAAFGGIDTKTAELVRTKFVKNVYAWMAGGLGVTALTSVMVMRSEAVLAALVLNPILFYGLIFAELGLVIWLSGWIHRMSVSTASYAYLAYSVLNGLTLSVVFLRYTPSSVAIAFTVAAAMFGSAAVYGTVTKRDLTGVGAFAGMALWGLIIATIVNIFLQSRAFDYVVSYVGVVIFTILAAYDAQKVKEMGYHAAGAGEAALSRYAIIGALALYLDFINIFLFLLRIFGSSRD